VTQFLLSNDTKPTTDPMPLGEVRTSGLRDLLVFRSRLRPACGSGLTRCASTSIDADNDRNRDQDDADDASQGRALVIVPVDVRLAGYEARERVNRHR